MKHNTLPEKWAVRRIPSNHKEINAYFSKLNNREYASDGTFSDREGNTRTHDFQIFPHIYSSTFRTEEIPHGYEEISWKVFKEFVLLKKKKQKIKYCYEIY